MYTATTHGIKVTATPHYLPAQSAPHEGVYIWAYVIIIENQSPHTVQLLNRYWSITDDRGNHQEVRGPGVVGEQPVLKPGESFRYSSGTHLAAPSGIMRGSYQMVREDGTILDVDIPAFSLDSEEKAGLVN